MGPLGGRRAPTELGRHPRSGGSRAVVAVLGAVLALLAMHGVTAHAVAAGHHHDELASGPLAIDQPDGAPLGVASHDPADDPTAAEAGAHQGEPTDGDDGAAEDHDHRGSCPSCGHGAGALCALIVLGLLPAPRRATTALDLRAAPAARPPAPPWSPDPPVPKLVPLSAPR